jgi:hypothetical protein
VDYHEESSNVQEGLKWVKPSEEELKEFLVT